MKGKTLERLPRAGWYLMPIPSAEWANEVICDSIVILPARFHLSSFLWYLFRSVMARCLRMEPPYVSAVRYLHDSGFRCMSFVCVLDGKALCRLPSCSDVVHIEGIGGLGYRWGDKYHRVPDMVSPSAWSIDCLAGSGLLRLFCHGKVRCGPRLSSFEVWRAELPKEERVS